MTQKKTLVTPLMHLHRLPLLILNPVFAHLEQVNKLPVLCMHLLHGLNWPFLYLYPHPMHLGHIEVPLSGGKWDGRGIPQGVITLEVPGLG